MESIFLILSVLVLSCRGEPMVETPVGNITGTEREFEFDGKAMTIHEYLGIPYAEPPVGELRLEKPVPRSPFTTPYRAVEYGPACLQLPKMGGVLPMSEDCLSLNVFVPAGVNPSKPDTGYPVMIYIHGGGFTIGSSRELHGSTLSAFGDVIVVTINYRLDALGFASMGNPDLRGNYGLWDQQVAIQWVNDNIESFGGDPNTTVLFGESAGAVSVNLQSLYIGNRGLFHGVIAESGTVLTQRGDARSTIHNTQLFAEILDCNDTVKTSQSAKECIQSLSETSMEKTYQSMQRRLTFIPLVDDDFIKFIPERSVTRDSKQISEEENFFGSIHFMTGVNSHEGVSFIGFLTGGNPETLVVQRASMDSVFIPRALMVAYPAGYPEELAKFVSAEYTNWQSPDDPVLLRDMYVKMLGDTNFVVPGIEMSRKHSSYNGTGNTFLYSFVAKPSRHYSPTASWIDGATHTDELPFVFGFDIWPLPYFPEGWEIKLSKGIMTLWTNFAKTGDPNVPGDAQQYLGTTWAAYDTQNQRYLEFQQQMAESKTRLAAKTDNIWVTLVPGLIEALNQTGCQSTTCQPCKNDASGCQATVTKVTYDLLMHVTVMVVLVKVFLI